MMNQAIDDAVDSVVTMRDFLRKNDISSEVMFTTEERLWSGTTALRQMFPTVPIETDHTVFSMLADRVALVVCWPVHMLMVFHGRTVATLAFTPVVGDAPRLLRELTDEESIAVIREVFKVLSLHALLRVAPVTGRPC